MSKVIITIEDTQDGLVGLTTEFDPPITTDESLLNVTPAQSFALVVLKAIQDESEEI